MSAIQHCDRSRPYQLQKVNWKDTLRAAIADGREADLLNFDCAEVPFCNDLAEANGIIFKAKPLVQTGHFFRD